MAISDQPSWPIIPRVEIFVITWNDIKLLPYMIRFYRERLGLAGLRISVYDNESDDGTPEVARALCCHVHSFSTGGKFDDLVHIDIKNHKWKESEAEWILVIDVDEWVDIRPRDLDLYESFNVSIINPKPYTLVSANDTFDLTHLHEAAEGERTFANFFYAKPCLFNHRLIQELNARPGGHWAYPDGQVKYLHDVKPAVPIPKLFHMKFFNKAYLVNRFDQYAPRLPQSSLEQSLALQYLNSTPLYEEFARMRKMKQPIPGVNQSVFVAGEGGTPIRH